MYCEKKLLKYQLNTLNKQIDNLNNQIIQSVRSNEIEEEWKECLEELNNKNQKIIESLKYDSKDCFNIYQNFNKIYKEYYKFEEFLNKRISYRNEIDVLSATCESFFNSRNIHLNKPLLSLGTRNCIKLNFHGKSLINIPAYDICNPVAILMNYFHEIGHYIVTSKKLDNNIFDFKKYNLRFPMDNKNWTQKDNLIWTKELLADGLITGQVGPVYVNTFSKYSMVAEAHPSSPSNDLRLKFCDKILHFMGFDYEQDDWERKIYSFTEQYESVEEQYNAAVGDFYKYYISILEKEFADIDVIKSEHIKAEFFSAKILKLEPLKNDPLITLLSACIAAYRSDEIDIEPIIISGYKSLAKSCLMKEYKS